MKHIWPSCTMGLLTYRKVHSHILSRLLTSNHAAFFGMVANSRACNPSAGHQLMGCVCRSRCSYHDARRHTNDPNVRSDQVVPKLQPGWTIYGVLLLMYLLLLLLLLPLEAELSRPEALLPFTCQQASICYLTKKLSSIRHY